MALNTPANRPDFQPLSSREYLNGPVRPELTQFAETVQDAGPQTLNRVNAMSDQQRQTTLQDYVRERRQHCQIAIFDIARTQHAQLQPEIALMRTQIPFTGTRIDQILDRLGAAPPLRIPPRGNLTDITFPPETYLKRTSEVEGLITQAITGNANIGCIIDAPKVKEDIDYLDSLKGQVTPDQIEFLENLKQKIIAYSTTLDMQNMQQWLRPRSQMDQVVGKFGRLAVFLALSVGAIVNGVISLRNKSSPTAALLMAGGAFFAANPGFLNDKDQKSVDSANQSRALLQNLVDRYNIQGSAWRIICGQVVQGNNPALQAFINAHPGPTARLFGNRSVNDTPKLTDKIKNNLFTSLASGQIDRKPDGTIDPESLNTTDRALYTMIIEKPAEFLRLAENLARLRSNSEAIKLALGSIETGAWLQAQPKKEPPEQLPPNVA